VPTYQYACTACGHELEAVQAFSDDPLTECPTCEGRLRKVFGSVGVVFKGSGFYRTDSRSESTAAKAKSESSESSTAASSSDTKSDSKSDAKSDAKPDSKSSAKESKTDGAGKGSSKKPVATGS
jgi:putative FmdB family regulatory protein